MINIFCSFVLLYKAFLVIELIRTEMGPAGKTAMQLLCIVSKHEEKLVLIVMLHKLANVRENFFALHWHMSAEITECTEGQITSAKSMRPGAYM